MAQRIDSKAVADYLSRVRGTGITPSFGDAYAPDFIGPKQGPRAYEFNPLMPETEETEEEKLERERQEQLEEVKATWKAPEEYTSLENIREAKTNFDFYIADQITKARKEIEKEQQLPELIAKQDLYVRTSPTIFKSQIDQLDQQIGLKQKVVDRQLALNNGKIVGLKATDYSDLMHRKKQLEDREKTLILQEEDKKFQRHQDMQFSTRKKGAKLEAIISQGLTEEQVENAKTVTGKEYTVSDIAALDSDTVKLIKKASTSYTPSVGDTAGLSKEAREFAQQQAKNNLTDDEYQEYKRLQDEWGTIADVEIAKMAESANGDIRNRVTLTKHEHAQYKKKEEKKLALEQKVKAEKQAIIDKLKRSYKDTKLTIELLDPSSIDFDSNTDKKIAKEIYNYLVSSYNKKKQLSTFSFLQAQQIKAKLSESFALEQLGVEPRDIIRIYQDMIDNTTLTFSKKYSDVSGVMLTTTDPILSRFK